MSRIGKMPVSIPEGVTVTLEDRKVTVKGPKGELSLILNERAIVEIGDKEVVLTRNSDSKEDKSIHGLTRTLIANMIEGVTKGFEKKLEIQGVGYRAAVSGKKLTLTLGFSHPVEMLSPEGIEVVQDQKEKNILIVKGIDKQAVGEYAANIRKHRKPEPYKGKGIRYVGEYVPRKAGKTAAK